MSTSPSDPRPEPHVVVLCGATGDLAARKLLPGLLRLESAGLMPEEYRIIGTSRRGRSDEEIRGPAQLDFGYGSSFNPRDELEATSACCGVDDLAGPAGWHLPDG